MSLWYDKKGKAYASKGSSSWVKYYAEHLFSALTARLEGHFAGTEGKHKAEDVLLEDNCSIRDALDTKVDKIPGLGLSECDYSAAEKEKLAGISPKASAVGISLSPAGAEAFNDYGNTANIPYAHIEGRNNAAIVKGFYISAYTANTVTLDSVAGIEAGMPWCIFIDTEEKQWRYSGEVVSVDGNVVTVTEEELPTEFTPSAIPSYFGTFIVSGGSIGSFEVADTSGEFSCHVEGRENTGTLDSHAEGTQTAALGYSSHAEGRKTSAIGEVSHAEGLGTKAASDSQHVQGKYNLADTAGAYADIVGNGTSDDARSNAYTLDWDGNGRYAGKVYAESDKELATKAALDANVADLSSSKADRSEVLSKTNTESFAPTADYQPATKKYVDDSVAEAGGGDMLRNIYDTDQTGIVDDAERLGGQLPDYYAKQADMDDKPIRRGSGVASAIIWNDEGEAYGSTMKPLASGIGSFAAGFETSAAGYNATAFGSGTQAKGDDSIASGSWAVANGVSSAAFGDSVTANAYQTVVGKNNQEFAGATGLSDTTGSAFIVGIGTMMEYANGFRVTNDGYCYGQNAFAASGADYAEYFEWADGNPDNEDRRGCFVTLEGSKIRKATAEDTYILGVVSATPVIEGNAYTDQWQGMYLTDVFGERLTEVAEVPDTTDERTGRVIPAHTETRFILNPDYDDSKAYLGRNERPEWSAVGIVGQLVVIDDGSCEENGFCRIVDGGTAVKADASTPYRVMERLDETHVRVFVK